MLTNNNKNDIEQTHISYDPVSWRLYHDAYYAEGGFKGGRYILKHAKESAAKYQLRQKRAYFLNYCAPIIDTYRGYIFRKPIVRASNSEAVKAFWQNTGYNGNQPITAFMKDALLIAQIYGYSVIVIDKSATPAPTVADKTEPYGYILPPMSLLDWEVSTNNDFEWVKIREVVNIARTPLDKAKTELQYRVWFQDRWELYADDGKMIDTQPHQLGRVPILILRNKGKGGGNIQGISDIHAIARINARIYNLTSELDELLIQTAFPILTYSTESPKDLEGITLGTNRILTYPVDGTKPEYISPQPTSMDVYETRIDKMIEEIYRISSMKFQGGVVPSGVALAYEFEQTQQAIKNKAQNCEDAELETAKLISLWSGEDPAKQETNVTYAHDFSFSDLQSDIETALDVVTLSLGEKFTKEYKKNVTRKILPNLPTDLQRDIDADIDAARDDQFDDEVRQRGF